jgi:hypothetical protein
MPNTGPSEGSRRQITGLLADVIERVPQADRGGGLALAGRRRADRRDQDQLAVLLAFERVEILQRDLRLVVPEGLQVLFGDSELLARDRGDALHLGCLRDFDVRRHGDAPRASGGMDAILQDRRPARP